MELKQLEKKFNFKLTDEWTDRADFYIYRETTADGYEVFIATDNERDINISENVFYYDSDLSDVLEEKIREHLDLAIANGTLDDEFPLLIYVEDIEESYVEYAMDELKQQDDD